MRTLTSTYIHNPPHTRTVLELQKQVVDKSLQSFLTQYQQQFHPSAIHQHAILDDKMTKVLSQASPSFLAQQHHQLQQYFNQSHLPLQLHYFLKCQMQPIEKQHMMASAKCFSMNELPLTTEHVEAKIYPPIAPLSETPLLLQEIRAGVMGVSVGRLPGRYSTIMGKYLPVREQRDMSMVLASFINLCWELTLCLSPFTRSLSTSEHREAATSKERGLVGINGRGEDGATQDSRTHVQSLVSLPVQPVAW